MDIETVSVPKEALVEHIVGEALEYGVAEEHVGAPERGDFEIDYSIRDVDDWTVEIHDDQITLQGMTEGSYQVQTLSARRNPPGKAHPAEYEKRTVEIG